MPQAATLTGRDLDAWIAERVMGRVVCDSIENPPAPMKMAKVMVPRRLWEAEIERLDDHFGPLGHMPIPGYSTNIADAWQVVERMRELGWVSVVTVDNGAGRYCRFWKIGEDGRKVSHECLEAPTAPEAICLAAKAAIDTPLSHDMARKVGRIHGGTH